MVLTKLKYKDIKLVKEILLKKQGYIYPMCPICNRNLNTLKPRDLCLDHNHINGRVRAVLCRSCNAIEGKTYKNFVRYGLRKAGIDYNEFLWNIRRYTAYPETDFIHPKFKEKVKK